MATAVSDTAVGCTTAERVAAAPASGLLGDAAATMGAQVVALVTGTATAIITARVLGPEGKGMVALATLWVGLFALTLPMSAGYGFIYHIGQGRISLSRALSNTLTFAMLVGLLAIVISSGMALAWGAQLVPGVAFTYILIAALALPAMVFGSTASLCLIGAGWIKLGALIGALSSLVSVTLCCVLVLGLRLGVTGALWAVTGGAYASSVLLLALVGRRVRVRPALDIRAVISAVRFSLKLHWGLTAQFLNYRLDRFIVNAILGPAAVGVYGIAVTLSELIWNVPSAIGTAVIPRASSLDRATAEMAARACRQALLLVTIVCLGGAALGRLAIPLLFGPAFSGAYPAFVVLVPGTIAVTLTKVLNPYLVTRGYPVPTTYAGFAALGVTVVLNVLLVPRWGILGAAAASSIAYGVAAAIVLRWFCRVSGTRLAAVIAPNREDLASLVGVLRRAVTAMCATRWRVRHPTQGGR